MWPRAQHHLKCYVFHFLGFLVSLYHCVTEPLLLSPGRVAFLSARSKTCLLLLASSSPIERCLLDTVRETMNPTPL